MSTVKAKGQGCKVTTSSKSNYRGHHNKVLRIARKEKMKCSIFTKLWHWVLTRVIVVTRSTQHVTLSRDSFNPLYLVFQRSACVPMSHSFKWLPLEPFSCLICYVVYAMYMVDVKVYGWLIIVCLFALWLMSVMIDCSLKLKELLFSFKGSFT